MSKQQGFSLVEVLLSLSLGLLLTTLLFEMLLEGTRFFLQQLSKVSARQHAIQATLILREFVSSHRDYGCAVLSKDFSLHNSRNVDLTDPLVVHQASGRQWMPALPDNLIDKAKSGSDVLSLTRLSPDLNHLQEAMRYTNQLVVSHWPEFRVGDVVMVSACDYADVVTVSDVTRQQGKQRLIVTPPLQQLYRQYERVGRLQTVYFYIRDTGRQSLRGDPVYSLYWQVGQGQTEELVPGMEGMQLLKKAGVLAVQFVVPGVAMDWRFSLTW